LVTKSNSDLELQQAYPTIVLYSKLSNGHNDKTEIPILTL
jgi:hypothetical protein